MKKFKVFVSLPMHGIEEGEIIAKQNFLMSLLVYIVSKRDGSYEFELIDSVHHDMIDADAGRLVHLGESIKMMQDADIVIFSDDYMEGHGCMVERSVVEEYGIPYIDYNGYANFIDHEGINEMLGGDET